ncbi:MAG TPA: hypothetical protein VHD38_02660, partial [Candidatus Paceibacterota bacterium]|nr:hypothetical protein [Candidatus Paceibacterota bacterium]
GAAVTFSVRDTSNIADSFSNLIYSGDGLTLAVVNGARDRAYFIGLDRRGSTVQSPALAGKIKAAGFVGTDLLTPFVRTATQEWRYTGSAWQPSQAAHPLAYFICDAGYGYFDTDADAPRGCSKLTLDDHSITAKRNGLTATVYETANTLQWVESAVIPQVP